MPLSDTEHAEHKLTREQVEAFIRGQIEADKADGGERAKRTRCRLCPATIFMAPHPNTGRRAPWDADGKSHFATCPAAANFRKKK